MINISGSFEKLFRRLFTILSRCTACHTGQRHYRINYRNVPQGRLSITRRLALCGPVVLYLLQ